MKEFYITLMTCEEGDWEGVYVNADLFTEGHSISNDDWLNLIREYQHFNPVTRQFTLSSEQMDRLGNSFPSDFEDIPVEFLK